MCVCVHVPYLPSSLLMLLIFSVSVTLCPRVCPRRVRKPRLVEAAGAQKQRWPELAPRTERLLNGGINATIGYLQQQQQ